MMKLAALLLTAAALSAGTITSSATCSASKLFLSGDPETVTNSGPFSCAASAVNGPAPDAYVYADMGFSETITGMVWSLGVTLNAKATGGGFTSSLTFASIIDTESVTTDGPSRPGFAELTFSGWAASDSLYYGGSAASFDNYGLSWWGYSNYCGPLQMLTPACFAPVTIPVTIGDGSRHTVMVRADTEVAGTNSYNSQTNARASLAVQFFESDMTPVAMKEAAPAAVPEPGTWLLIVAGMLGALAARRLRR